MGRHGGRDRGGLPRDEYDRKERELKKGRPRSHSASSIVEGRGPFPHHVRNFDFRGLAGYRAVRAFAIGLPTRRSGVIAIFSSRSPALVALSESGTSGSNPPSSSGESRANLISSNQHGKISTGRGDGSNRVSPHRRRRGRRGSPAKADIRSPRRGSR